MKIAFLLLPVLQYEPNNRIVLEFRTILEELIKNPDMSLKNKGKLGMTFSKQSVSDILDRYIIIIETDRIEYN